MTPYYEQDGIEIAAKRLAQGVLDLAEPTAEPTACRLEVHQA